MEKKPIPDPNAPRYASCPFCTLQVEVGDAACPHCKKPLPPPGEEAEKPRAPLARHAVGRPRAGGDFWEQYGRWVKAAVPVVLALVVLALIYQRWVDVRVTVTPNPALPVKATLAKEGKSVIVRGAVTNAGEDVPDLSLKSIGTMAEFVYRDGRRYKKRIFPKTDFRGEGALLRGETGTFEIEAPRDGLEEVVLRAEVVDLTAGRELSPPGGRWRVVPGGN